MKRIFVFLHAILVFSLYACSVKQDVTVATPSIPLVTETADPISAAPTLKETIPPDYAPADYIGFFDPYFDYTSAPGYKVQYMALSSSDQVEMYDKAFSHWASKMNLDYGELWEPGGDVYAFYNQLTKFVGQGVDGFLLEADSRMYPRINEILAELERPWMSCATAPRDIVQEPAPLIHPYVKIDNYASGVRLTEKLIEFKEQFWPNVSKDEIGLIMADYSLYPQLHDYQQGTYDAWIEKTGLKDNFFTADNSRVHGSGFLDIDATPLNMKYIITENTDIKYWLFAAHYSSFAKSAVNVLDELGLNDNGCVVSGNFGYGTEPLQRQWDSGEQNAWKTAEYTPATIYTEPIIGALYAFMSGWATPETIWPQWVNVNDCGGEGGTYATLIVPSYWLQYDNYKRILKWTDVYAGANYYPDYPASGITQGSYSARAEVPAYYSIKAQN